MGELYLLGDHIQRSCLSMLTVMIYRSAREEDLPGTEFLRIPHKQRALDWGALYRFQSRRSFSMLLRVAAPWFFFPGLSCVFVLRPRHAATEGTDTFQA
jgi:hypothetical protein